jgi:hypothetical protein
MEDDVQVAEDAVSQEEYVDEEESSGQAFVEVLSHNAGVPEVCLDCGEEKTYVSAFEKKKREFGDGLKKSFASGGVCKGVSLPVTEWGKLRRFPEEV